MAGQPAADPCITSLVYRVMRLRSQFVKSPDLKFANIFKGVIRQILMLAKFTRYTVYRASNECIERISCKQTPSLRIDILLTTSYHMHHYNYAATEDMVKCFICTTINFMIEYLGTAEQVNSVLLSPSIRDRPSSSHTTAATSHRYVERGYVMCVRRLTVATTIDCM